MVLPAPHHLKHASKPSFSSSSISNFFSSSVTPQRRRLLLLPVLCTILFILYSLGSSPPSASIAHSSRLSAQHPQGSLNLDLTPSLPYYLSKLDTSLREAFASSPHLSSSPYPAPLYPSLLSPSLESRYAHLIPSHPSQNHTSFRHAPKRRHYHLTTSLINVSPLTPTLFASLFHTILLLSPSQISLSIIEGPSNDGTSHLIESVLCPLLLEMGVDPLALHVVTRRPKVDFANGNRIELLAKLREEAMVPFWRSRRVGRGREDVEDEVVVFFNDVYWSAGMMMELIHQHVTQGSDMTCAWDLLWGNDYFYDIWVARDIHTGDLFHPMSTTWSPSTDLFPTSPLTKARYDHRLPFQAYSCWNGIALFDGSALRQKPESHFRRSRLPPPSSDPPAAVEVGDGDVAAISGERKEEGECAQAEVGLFCKDLWAKGRGKILVVPGVRVGYERHVAEGARDAAPALLQEGSDKGEGDERSEEEKKDEEKAKAVGMGIVLGREGARGWFGWRSEVREMVDWIRKPPAKVRCHPWPEKNGLGDVNVWETTRWVDPLTG